jgi:hypothetical protein
MPALIVWDWGWQRPGVVPAMPGHLLCFVLIITIEKMWYKPPRGIKISLVKRKPPYCFPKQYGDFLLGLSVLTDGIILPRLLFQWKPPWGMKFYSCSFRTSASISLPFSKQATASMTLW